MTIIIKSIMEPVIIWFTFLTGCVFLPPSFSDYTSAPSPWQYLEELCSCCLSQSSAMRSSSLFPETIIFSGSTDLLFMVSSSSRWVCGCVSKLKKNAECLRWITSLLTELDINFFLAVSVTSWCLKSTLSVFPHLLQGSLA